MISTRVYILGLLENHGPLHGHGILLAARRDHIELWTAITPGSLYAMLKRLESEGHIAVVRTERAGKFPPRAVYEITAIGRQKYTEWRHQLLSTVAPAHDPFHMGLAFAETIPATELRQIITARIAELQQQKTTIEKQIKEHGAYFSAYELSGAQHIVTRLQTDILWHRKLLKQQAA